MIKDVVTLANLYSKKKKKKKKNQKAEMLSSNENFCDPFKSWLRMRAVT